MSRLYCLLAAALVLTLSTSAVPDPLGTGFTFQGELNQLGVPADGPFDFTFEIYDVSTGGLAITGLIEMGDLEVANGIFTVELDFGTTPFGDQQLWLEIGVREGASAGAYALLSPRQKLTVAPFAVRALSVTGVAWGDLTDIPADIADGDDGFTAEGELTSLLDDNYVASEGGQASNLTTTGTLSSPAAVRVTNSQDVGLDQAGAVVVGNPGGVNIGIDNNEIMARNNNSAATLILNREGGQVQVGDPTVTPGLTTLQLDVDAILRASDADIIPEVYELTNINCERGEMYIGRPNAADQDALCVCLLVNTNPRYYCFNP